MTDRRIDRNTFEYPQLLKEIPDPPKKLFAIGRPLEPAPYLAIVGTRKPTRYGIDVATHFAKELASAGLVIVSGMAIGIDTAAHRGALEAGMPTIAVLGCGLDLCYPPRNASLYSTIEQVGSIITEYPKGTPAMPYHFPERNRIIAGMCLGVVIVEGQPAGGAMITARLALEFGREVFAVPGPVHSPQSKGPHLLLRDGARLVSDASEILEDLQMTFEVSNGSAEPELQGLTPDEVRVLRVLEATPELIDVLAASASLPVSSAAATLCLLEVKGIAVRHPGSRFALSITPKGRQIEQYSQ